MKPILVFILTLCASVAWATEGALNGKFTVNEQGDQVQFAPGNLQYVVSTGTWQLAASQTTMVGLSAWFVNANPSYTGPIDLFPWADTYGDSIEGGWRMLTEAEWQYLLREEDPEDPGQGPMNAGLAMIVTQHVLMLVPDDWHEYGDITFTPGYTKWTANRYDLANQSSLEESGVVFLPCTTEDAEMSDYWGNYWSATPNVANKAYSIYFDDMSIYADFPAQRSNSYAIRLVKDVKETPTGVEPTANANAEAIKTLRNGQIVIVRDGKTYTILGQEK